MDINWSDENGPRKVRVYGRDLRVSMARVDAFARELGERLQSVHTEQQLRAVVDEMQAGAQLTATIAPFSAGERIDVGLTARDGAWLP